MRKRVIQAVVTLMAIPWIAVAEETVRVLPEDFNADKENQMMRSYLRKQVHAALDRRLERLEDLESLEQIRDYQDRRRAFFRETVALDSFKRTPLDPEVTGRLERDGYTVEKVIFESQPNFHVTGNLYLPDGPGPHPGILHPCGHSENGKAAGVYQKANILLARSGFVVLCYDPIGQGERKQLLDDKGRILRKGSSEHMALGVAPILLGRGLSSYMIWDGMRAIDYLQSRPEVDSDQIGCCGNSGGGNMTSYLMALDDRIQAAAPGCFMTTTRMKNEKPGPGDAEQNLFGQIREGLDHPDFAIIRAPKPTLILAATHDFVPIEGTWEAFRQNKRIYTKLGYPERIDLIEAPEKHGFSKRLREGAVRFFFRWLKGESVEIFELEEVAVERDADLLCTPEGQVMRLKGERSVLDLNLSESIRLKKGRSTVWAELSGEGRRDLVRRITGIQEFGRIRPSTSDYSDDRRGPELKQYLIRNEGAPGIVLPTVETFRDGKMKERAVHLFFHDEGKAAVPESALEAIAGEGDSALAVALRVDLRDIGETKSRNWRFYGADAFIADMLGSSYLAMRTEDILFVRESYGPDAWPEVHLHAWGELVPPAIHAMALEPDLFESLTIHGGLATWQTVIKSRDPMPHFHNVVHGALRHYDLADLLEMIPAEKLKIVPEKMNQQAERPPYKCPIVSEL